MAHVDWSQLLPEAEVAYSSLETDEERGAFDDTIAELKLPGGYYIDVSWSPDDSEYVVRLYRDYFENLILVDSKKTVHDVIQTVMAFADSTKVETT
jgi:hypothetical protein